MKTKKQSLERKIQKIEKILSENKLTELSENLKELKIQIDDDVLRLSVIGEFNHGKSTFINAFLNIPKEQWLTMDMNESTSVLTEITYGVKPTAKAYSYNDNVLEFDLKDLATYTTGDDAQEKYYKVIVEIPNELLKEGVAIIDTPGVNSLDETKIEDAFKAIKMSHAAIYITNRTEIPPKQINYLVDAFKADITKLFILCNPDDSIDDNSDREVFLTGIRESVLKVLDPTLSGAEINTDLKNKVYLISALTALKGRISDNEKLYKKSGLQVFEENFWNFVLKEKYQVIYERQQTQLKRIIYFAIEQLEAAKASLNFNSAEYDQALETLNKTLEEVRSFEKELLTSSNEVIQYLTEELKRSWFDFIQSRKPGINDRIYKLEVNTSFKQHVEILRKNLETDVSEWVDRETDELEKNVREMISEIEEQLEEGIERLSQTVSGNFESFGPSFNFEFAMKEKNGFQKIIPEILLVIVLDLLIPGGPIFAIIARVLGKNMGDKLIKTITTLLAPILGGNRIEEQKRDVKNNVISAFANAFLDIETTMSSKIKSFQKTTKKHIESEIKFVLSERIENLISAIKSTEKEKEDIAFDLNNRRADYVRNLKELSSMI